MKKICNGNLKWIFTSLVIALLLVSACSNVKNEGGVMIKEISTKNAPAAIGPYSQAVMVNNTLYASGAIGVDPVTGTPAEGITGQAEQALKNIGAILKEAGYDYSNVVKTTCFLADMNDFNTFNEVYSKYFTTKPLPARSCVAVKTLPKNLLCEIEILAVK